MPTPFQNSLIAIATQQHAHYHELKETDPPLTDQIRQYWEQLGKTFPGTSTYWSAVFISWCVMKAAEKVGVDPKGFLFARRHSQFFHLAIQNAGNDAVFFWGHRIEDYSPKVGDIIQNNQPGDHFDFAHAASHEKYASHSAIVVDVQGGVNGHLTTIGGNEHDSVGERKVLLKPNGRIVQRHEESFISIMECRL